MLPIIQQLMLLVTVTLANRQPNCGGIYTNQRGIIQTPGFPHQLSVPINCEWIIDAQQNFATTQQTNTSIIVYFTQLFVNEGLKFTEYQIYDKTYQLDGRLIHSVNETNIVQVRWIQSFQNFLVITLKLDSNDSVHLRVLDQFLDVYGFNITYEITINGNVRMDACSMMDCGFTGVCYDHYTRFSCDCFDGYSGANCSLGPKSLCNIANESICKNGGTCIHVGTTAVKCRCRSGYTGDTCQIRLHTQDVCDNCVTSCQYDGNLQNACKCDNQASNSSHDRIGYTCTMHLGNLPDASDKTLKSFIQNQIYRALKINYLKIDSINVENSQYFQSSAEVTFHLFASKKDEKNIRSIFSKWADRGYIVNLTIVDKDFNFRPLIDLQSISINHQDVILEHDEFILSCVSRGSPTMTFRWYKDGVFVNVTETKSRKWTRLIRDPHVNDQYTALLGIEQADILDGGLFTCQVANSGLQQCLSRRVVVKGPPTIKVQPMSKTVKKGDNFTINCVTIGTPIQKFTYSWTKNKELIPIRSDSEKYEILYPGGSILQVFNIDRNVIYSCLVQDGTISTEVAINVYVIDRDSIRTCPEQNDWGLEWSQSAPDTVTLKMCPKSYTFPGCVQRSCTLNDGIKPVWLLPDYSHCTSNELDKIWKDFNRFKLGYQTSTTMQTLENCWKYLEMRSNRGLYPGEGTRFLHFLKDVILYNKEIDVGSNFHNMTIVMFDIIDLILSDRHSLIQQEQIELLQEIIDHQIESIIKFQFQFNITKSTIELLIQQKPTILFDYVKTTTNKWRPFRLINDKSIKQSIGIVNYRNLNTFLPTRSVLRLRDGNEIEYEIVSQIVRVTLKQHFDKSPSINFEWTQENFANFTRNNNGWFLRCAISDTVLFAFSWNTTICTTQIINDTFVKCTCPKFGTFALLSTRLNHAQVMLKHIDRNEIHSKCYIILICCTLSFFASLICTFVQFLQWILIRTYIDFLQFLSSISIAGVMLGLILTTIDSLSDEMLVIVLALIEVFFLTGLSTHISILLTIYTETIDLPNLTTSKQTITGINIGVPIITIFGNHLVHRTMDIKLKSWWLMAGTSVFHVFLIVVTILTILFIFLYITVYRKLMKFINVQNQDGVVSKRRLVLLKKLAFIFTTLVAVAVSSILYVNFHEIIWWQYEFGFVTVLQGLTLIVCYIIKSESKLYLFHGKFKSQPDCSFSGIASIGNSMNAPGKNTETDNEAIQQCAFEQDNVKIKTTECYQMSNLRTDLPECVTNKMKTFTIECDFSHLQIVENNSKTFQSNDDNDENDDKIVKIQQQSVVTVPTMSVRCPSPDIISTSNCKNLDLVASHASNLVQQHDDEATNSALPTIKNQKFGQVVGDLNQSCTVKTEEIEQKSMPIHDQHNLDKMLDQISHDLDYLLDRNDAFGIGKDASTDRIRPVAETVKSSVIFEVEEQDEDDKQ